MPYHGIILPITIYLVPMKVSTTISIEKAILDAAREVAESERRTFSAQLEKWIEEKLAEVSQAQPQPQEAAA